MSDGREVRRPEGPKVRRSDEDLDRAIASLTDASPSPALRANVMRRIADAHPSPTSPASHWRLALAAVAMIVLAVSTWFALKPAPVHQSAGRLAGPHQAARPSPGAHGDESVPVAETAPRPEQARETGRSATGRSRLHVFARAAASRPVEAPREAAETPPIDDAAAPFSLIQMQPIPDPSPVAFPPVTVQPIDIPLIEIPPVEDRADKEPPAAGGADKKQPGATAPTAK